MVQIHVKTLSGELVTDAIDGPITVGELAQILTATRSSEVKEVPQFVLDACVLNSDDVVGDGADTEVELNVVWLTALQAAGNDLKNAQHMLARAEDAIIELELPCFEADFLEAAGNPYCIAANRTADLEKELTAALIRMDDTRQNAMNQSVKHMNNLEMGLNCNFKVPRRRADFVEARLQADFLEAAGAVDLDDELKAAHMHMERMRQNVVRAEKAYHETAVACWQILHSRIVQGHCPMHCQECRCLLPVAEFQSDFGIEHVRPAAEQLGIVLSDDDLAQVLRAARSTAWPQ